ncbi:MAG: ABC transporter ATP-binding protein [Spirochaetes bacterium]|nr:MAG: ABC transporter ATP-binding protein [Spirochaetota bacterium]
MVEKSAGGPPLLEVQDLRVEFRLPDSNLHAVRGVSFSIPEGATLGLVGESGCGKSVSAFSILGLISPPGEITGGSVRFKGADLRMYSDAELDRVRGREIAMIFQEPMSSLNPVLTIGYQIAEPLARHLGMDRRAARARTIELLDQVGIPSPARRVDSYPHELSGGMRQRVMIAMALSCNPSLLIADEPTTALDVTIQAQILELLLAVQQEHRMSMLLITHDLGIVANIADRIVIMYAGAVMEEGSTAQIFSNPLHPYTIALFESIPRIGEQKARLATIPGSVPTITHEPQGCVFHPRCPRGDESCTRAPIPLIPRPEGRTVRCIKA